MGNCLRVPLPRKKSLKEFSAQTGFFDSANDLTDHFKVSNNRNPSNVSKSLAKADIYKCNFRRQATSNGNDAYQQNKVRRFSYPHRNSATPPSRETNSRSSLQRIDAKGDRMGVKVPGKANQQHVLLSEYCPMKSFSEINKCNKDIDDIDEFLQAEIACNLEALPGDSNNLFNSVLKTKQKDKKSIQLPCEQDIRMIKTEDSPNHQYKRLSDSSLDKICQDNKMYNESPARCTDLSLKPGSMQRPPPSRINQRQSKPLNYSQNNLDKKQQSKRSLKSSSWQDIQSEAFPNNRTKQAKINSDVMNNTAKKEMKSPEEEAEEEEHPVEYTFYVEDKEECRKPFIDRRVPSIASACRCKVIYHDRDSSDRRIYYKGNPVRPVTVTSPSIAVLRRCLGRIDNQFPHFNARAFLSNTLAC